MKLKEYLWELGALEGASGFEHGLSSRVEALLDDLCDEVYTDPLGSIHGILYCGEEDAPKLLLDAHIDEIGLMVSGITDEGFLRVVNLGGVDSRILPGAAVTVHGREPLYGVMAAKPPHIQTAEEMKQAIALKDMVVDIGYDRQQAEKRVSVGDMITFRAQPEMLLGQVVTGRALDDRAGVAVLLSALNRLKKHRRSVDIEVLISAQEETGLRGAQVGGWRAMPDLALAVDVSHAKTPDASGDNVYTLGGGAMIGVGPSLHRRITDQLCRLAEEHHIPHQVEVMGGDTGTNAWALQVVGQGIPCGLLSIPLRYMHTTIETLSLEDAKAVRDLICRFALGR
ncbi:MAG: M42 family metallopeptidase [Eubacteriales bacterium]|jgi:putative aminopeptidase FrvX